MHLDPSDVARALGGEVSAKHRNTVLAPGPGHSAADRSLSVTLDRNALEGFVCHSFCGDDPIPCRDHVRKCVGLDPWKPIRKGNGAVADAAARKTVLAEYIYKTQHGEPYLKVIRFEPKEFRQQRWDGAAWAWGKPKGPKIPYRLPEMQRAVHDTVIIVEGEKDVDRLTDLGFVATTASEGAGKWTNDLAQWFERKTIYIVADKDEPGRQHAQQVAASLYSVAETVRIVEMPTGKDVSEWLDNGGDTGQLIDICRSFPISRLDADAVGDPVDGAQLLSDVHAFLGRFVAYPSAHAHVAHVLWIGHTHLMDAWDSTPRIAFLSPEPGSGKSRALEVSELLVPNPIQAVNVTPAYLFRKVGAGHPTLLYDEIDTVFGPKARDNEEIRGLLNAGHRRGAVAGRCVVKGKTVETEEIPAYCAVALAGLGGLPDTILSRSVIIKMRRRSPGEAIEPFRRRDEEAAGTALRKQLQAWAKTIREDMARARPELPATVTDRAADVWEPLLAVAESAGGDWPVKARVAAVALVALSKDSTPSLGIRLLADLRQVFGEADVMATETILTALHALDESPWADIRGKPLDSRGLANRLREYEIKPKVVRIGDSTPRGYERSAFRDAWDRYL